MKIVIGLGNPGEQYQNTRHNAGWLALDYFAGDKKWLENKKFQALTCEVGEFLLIKPLTFMNNSGQTAQKVLNYYKLLPKSFGLINKKDSDLTDSLIVIHDDVDFNLGEWKISTNSGSAGHRGVQSIINYLKTKKITRIRLGVKNELFKTHIPPEKFVLQPFGREEKTRLAEIFSQINLQDLK